jgi:hypothetical protein
MTRMPIVIGVSGPDGAGKSALATGSVRALAAEGIAARKVYLYGCIFCRRWTGKPPTASGRTMGRSIRFLLQVHAVVDAAELSVRLVNALRRTRRLGRDAVLVTDRSPVDGLAKHLPRRRSLAARWFRRSSARYDHILVLDGDAATLAARDREHGAADLQLQRDRFRRVVRALDARVRVVSADASASTLVDAVVRIVRPGQPAAKVGPVGLEHAPSRGGPR